MTPDQVRREVIADLGRFTHDPLGFVLWAFPWGVQGTSLESEDGPDTWQREQLKALGDDLQVDPFKVIQDATASGHGIGKSSQVSWLILWAIMTHEDTRGVVTANTEGQLRTKTWPELSKWYSLLQFDCLREMFVLEATSIHSTEAGHERTWRIDAIPWSERNTEAFAGLHNAGKRVILLFDEASSIIDAIWDTASGGLTDAGTEIMWLAYGNPTRNTGRFHQAIVGRFRNQWRHRMIDGRNVKRTNKDLLAKWVETYGEDSDFVRVRVKGQFPRASSAQFEDHGSTSRFRASIKRRRISWTSSKAFINAASVSGVTGRLSAKYGCLSGKPAQCVGSPDHDRTIGWIGKVQEGMRTCVSRTRLLSSQALAPGWGWRPCSGWPKKVRRLPWSICVKIGWNLQRQACPKQPGPS
ncbi:hypothetical protein [Novosphingobium sp. ERN07]|uniref:hypothetical protein n=1 Tax=Novosphingobium sp. ERN07 TaxID=2726187 RepID=UPI001F0D7BFA|nr:hypothetical protein [Novosphingobium sp. ERN07]